MELSTLETVLDWNRDEMLQAPYRPPLADETVAKIFEQQAKRTPLRCAIITETNAELNYLQVNRKAEAICRCLLLHADRDADHNLIPACVLVALSRTSALPISLLAVVKSELAYWGVDLTMQSPAVVLKNMKTLNCRIAIVDSPSSRMLFPVQPPPGLAVVTVTDDGDVSVYRGETSVTSVATASPFVCPAKTMYIEFTSGSTGQPKAVAVPHRAAIGYLRNSADIYRWNEHTRSLLYHSVSFDLHVHDLWGAWCHGGLVIPTMVPIADVNGVWERGIATNATHLSMTPFGFSLFTKLHLRKSNGAPTPYASMTSVMLCGEALELNSVRSWLELPVRPSIVNSYGITETTVINTFLEVTPERLGWPSSIGRRLPHTLMLLLSDTLEVIPHGERGELYLAGDCLAHGYITSVEKNDTSFLPIPPHLVGPLQVTAPSMSLRVMYKTGDLAYFSEEFGGFVFCGRSDAEVKVGGFRIHPLEVEETLHKLECVKNAVVVPAKHPDGRTVLVACVVPRQEGVTRGQIRSLLRDLVSEYKIPLLHIAPVGFGLPVTASNKVDRVTVAAWAAKHVVLPPGETPAYFPGEAEKPA